MLCCASAKDIVPRLAKAVTRAYLSATDVRALRATDADGVILHSAADLQFLNHKPCPPALAILTTKSTTISKHMTSTIPRYGTCARAKLG